MTSPTQWTWVWENSGRCWRTGKIGMLQSSCLYKKRHERASPLSLSSFPLLPLSSPCQPGEDSVKRDTGKRALTRNQIYWLLELGLSGSRTVRNKFLPIYGNLFYQCELRHLVSDNREHIFLAHVMWWLLFGCGYAEL